MKAVHISWVAFTAMAGVLVEQIGIAMQGKSVDTLATGTAIVGIVAVFLPAAQLAFSWFHQPRVKGDMPVTTAEIKSGAVENPSPPRLILPDTNAGDTSRHP